MKRDGKRNKKCVARVERIFDFEWEMNYTRAIENLILDGSKLL